MSDASRTATTATRIADLSAEVGRLREEVRTSHAISAAALARATRLAQVVSALVPLTDPQDVLHRGATEVAEQFSVDIAAFLVPDPSGPMTLGAHWGIPRRSLPATVDDPPPEAISLDQARPVVAGPVEELGRPEWLAPVDPRHVAWGRLAVRDEVIAYMLLARRGDEPFSASDVKELGLVVSRIALAVDNGRLYSRTQEQVRRLRRLHEVTAELAGLLDVDTIVGALATTVATEVPVSGVAVYLAGKRSLKLAAEAGVNGNVPSEITDEDARTWPDDRLMLMGVGDAPTGALLLTERPLPGGEPDSFLQHLADLGGLTLAKALMFERTRTQAETDPLTRLPNRTFLMQRLESAVAQCREHGTDLAVIFVDLDNFKAVNDTYGHDVGDQLLVAVAARLTDVARPVDTLARLGGDEFVVVRTDLAHPDEALATVQQIRTAMAAPFGLGDVIVTSEASIGVGLASSSNYHAKTVMRTADAGMYADKMRDRHDPPGRPRATWPGVRPRSLVLPSAGLDPRPRPAASGGAARTIVATPPATNLRSWCEAWASTVESGLEGPTAHAIRRTLAVARDHLELDLAWLTRFIDGRQVFQAFDGDPSAFGLSPGSAIPVGESYCARVLDGRLPAVVPDTSADDRTSGLAVTTRHHLGAYVGAPVFTGRGDLYGMLCAVSRTSEPLLRHRDAKLLQMLAALLTEPLTMRLARDSQSSAFVRNALSMLDEGGLSVDLQPIVDLRTGEIVSVEALARFATHPYSVEGWFAQAHEAGCGTELEIDAILTAQPVLGRLPADLTLAVNASPDVACSPALRDIVGADPTRIVVEITEHLRASEPALFAASIHRLQANGVQVAIDDAGTGYSDLRQILELQPDIVKLDRDLVAGVDQDPVKMALIQAFAAFAEDTGTVLVAEGVSTAATRDTLRALKVPLGQGYALGWPEPAGRLLDRLPPTGAP